MRLRTRFDYATELRAYAREVEALVLADRRHPEAPIVGKVDLAQRMHRRASEVMRHDDPAERGTFRADTVFASRKARPVRAEIRGARWVRATRSVGKTGLRPVPLSSLVGSNPQLSEVILL